MDTLQATEELRKLRVDISDAQTVLNNERLALAEVEKEKKALESEIEKLEGTIATLEGQLENTQEELEGVEEAVTALEGYKAGLQEEVNELTETVARETETLATLEKTSGELRIEVDSLTDILKEKEGTCDALDLAISDKRTSYTTEAEAIEQEIAGLRAQKNDVVAIIESGESKVTELTAKEFELAKEVEKAASELAELELQQERVTAAGQARNAELYAERDALAVQLAEADAALTAAKAELIEVQKEIDSLRKGFMDLTRREEKLRDFCDRNGIDHTNF